MDPVDGWRTEPTLFLPVRPLVVDPVGGYKFVSVAQYLSSELPHYAHAHFFHLAADLNVLLITIVALNPTCLRTPILKRELEALEDVASEFRQNLRDRLWSLSRCNGQEPRQENSCEDLAEMKDLVVVVAQIFVEKRKGLIR